MPCIALELCSLEVATIERGSVNKLPAVCAVATDARASSIENILFIKIAVVNGLELL